MAIKNKIILTLILSFILIVLINVLIVFPLINKIKNNSQELINVKQKQAIFEAEYSDFKKFDELKQQVESFLIKADNLIIDPEIPIEFINFLEETSKQANIEIKSLSISDQKLNKNDSFFIIFEISCESSFKDFMYFLRKQENSLYLTQTQNIIISKIDSDQENYEKNVKAIFQIKVLTKI